MSNWPMALGNDLGKSLLLALEFLLLALCVLMLDLGSELGKIWLLALGSDLGKSLLLALESLVLDLGVLLLVLGRSLVFFGSMLLSVVRLLLAVVRLLRGWKSLLQALGCCLRAPSYWNLAQGCSLLTL